MSKKRKPQHYNPKKRAEMMALKACKHTKTQLLTFGTWCYDCDNLIRS